MEQTIGKEFIAWIKTGKSMLAPRAVKINSNGLKLATPLEIDTVCFSTRMGKRKIPRYLYHLTTQSNYEKIVESGVLKLGSDPDGPAKLIENGVFLFDLKNLIKRWKNVINNKNGILDLDGVEQRGLLLRIVSNHRYNQAKYCVQKECEPLVLLRISTDMLNHDSLFVRSLTDMHNQITIPIFNSRSSKFLSDVRASVGKINKEKFYQLKEDLTYIYKNLFGNEPAKSAKLRTQRKECIEYISKEEIPLSAVSKVGTCEPVTSMCVSEPEIIKQRWNDLLMDSPEINMMKLW